MIKQLCNRSIVKLDVSFALTLYSRWKLYFISSHVYPSDSQESVAAAIRASNFPGLVSERPRYCCPVEIFYFGFIEV